MTASKYLINGRPLIVLPDLATVIGLNEAIVLQQIHYWLLQYENTEKTTHYHDDTWWVYNTYANWQKTNFPFWSERTIQRIILSLEKQGLLVSREPNKAAWDHTKWYTIAYDVLDTKMAGDKALRQLGTISDDNLAHQNHDNLARSNYTESNEHESTTESSPPTPFSNVGDSSTYTPDPSRNGKKAPNTKGQIQKKAAAPAAISEVVTDLPAWIHPAAWDKQPPALLDKRFAKSIPEGWTDSHVAIWRYLFGKSSTSNIPKTGDCEWVTVVYTDMLAKTHLPALTPLLIWDFVNWYFGRDFVKAKVAEGKDYNLPAPHNTDTWAKLFGEWLKDRQASAKPSTPVYVAPEVNPYERQQAGVRVGVGQ